MLAPARQWPHQPGPHTCELPNVCESAGPRTVAELITHLDREPDDLVRYHGRDQRLDVYRSGSETHPRLGECWGVEGSEGATRQGVRYRAFG